jgi:uncharacterized protein
MNTDIYRQAAESELDSKIYAHSLALSACMAGLYDHFSSQGLLSDTEPDRDSWVIAGLIHDIDYSEAHKDTHPHKTKEILAKYDLTISDEVADMVASHAPDLTGRQPANKAEWSIYCADSLTGLIMAVAYVYPSKRLVDVQLSSILKRFHKEPRFAAGTRRDEVSLCTRPDGLNLSIDEFIDICLKSMQGIAEDLGV